ncbi:dTMP kinase [Pectinatus frisingensis]|jgi:dTMP kinase|uniref:dTMP kinase n=1 Tax=Pectinatus frisingensis TaxID=865 RepID=UPI0015F73399|nr:deoxynucleoside kinase [Pectinatus frisingensis]
MKGKLITIEAGDGSGKATQTTLLYERLSNESKNVYKFAYPDYNSESSSLVKMYLRGDFGQSADDVNAYAASTFFAVDRYASYHMYWKKLYENGATILVDRYTTSNMVHQAVKISDPDKRQDFLDWLCDLEFIKMGLPEPDLVIFLDMPPQLSNQLLSQRTPAVNKRDIHERDSRYLYHCYNVYKQMAKKYHWQTVTCTENNTLRTVDSIHQDVYQLTKKFIY